MISSAKVVGNLVFGLFGEIKDLNKLKITKWRREFTTEFVLDFEI